MKTMTSETILEDLQALLDSGNIFGAGMLMDDILFHLSSRIEHMRDEIPYSAAGDALDTQLDLQSRRLSEFRYLFEVNNEAFDEASNITKVLDEATPGDFDALRHVENLLHKMNDTARKFIAMRERYRREHNDI